MSAEPFAKACLAMDGGRIASYRYRAEFCKAPAVQAFGGQSAARTVTSRPSTTIGTAITMNVLDLPFIKHLGLRISADGTLSLEVADHHKNHLGTVHATVLYGIAEACSGQAVIDAFFRPYPNALVVIRRAAVKYRSPARADLSARVKKTDPALPSVMERLQVKGAVRWDIEVETRSGDEIVAIATFEFFIKVA